MRTFTFLSAAALIAIANPAHAQLGGGLGGVLGGGGSGSVSGPLGSLPRVDNSTIGSVSGSGDATATKRVDRRSGKVEADGAANGRGNGSVAQSATGPLGAVTGSGQGSANASGSGSADAQLIGTDAVRPAVGDLRNKAGQTVGTTRDRAGNIVQSTRGAAETTVNSAGSASGSAAGSANGAASGGNNMLALAGSAAGDAAGTFEVKPGMKLLDANGEKIGKVREVIADGRGRVEALVVKVDGETATLPAGSFSTDGSALITGMTEGQIKSAAAEQKAEKKADQQAAKTSQAPAEAKPTGKARDRSEGID